MTIDANNVKSLMNIQQEVHSQLQATIEDIRYHLAGNNILSQHIQEYIILDADKTYHIRVPNNDNVILTRTDTFDGLSDMILMHMSNDGRTTSYKYFPKLEIIVKYGINTNTYNAYEELANNKETLCRLMCNNI